MRYYYRKGVILIFLLVFLNLEITALPSSAEHAEHWIKCFGLPEGHKSNLQDFSSEIDRWQPFYQDLQKIFPQFTANHRYLFHWGFSAHPNSSRALISKLDRFEIVGERRDFFYQLLIIEQQKRNKKMIEIVEKIFKSRIRSSAIASLLYDIHILDDYNDQRIVALMNKNMLIDDITKNLRKAFRTKSSDAILEIIKARQLGDTKKVINILEKELPGLVDDTFGKDI